MIRMCDANVRILVVCTANLSTIHLDIAPKMAGNLDSVLGRLADLGIGMHSYESQPSARLR